MFLQEVLDRYRLLMKATSDAVYDYDLGGNRIEWNENLKLWGYQPADVEPSVNWWMDRIHPDDRAQTIATLDQAIHSESGTFESTYQFRCGDGRYRHVLDKGFVLKDEAGVPIRVVGAMHEVHIYREMFERNPQPMWAFHLENLRFLAVNEMAIRLYGYSREEFLRMSLTDVRPPEDVPLLRSVVTNPDRHHEGRTIWRHFTKAGQLLHVEVRTQDLEIDGAPARMALITDVSRRIAVEQQLREAQKLEAVGQLAGGIANDFSNLLAVIQSLTRQSLNLAPPEGLLRSNLEDIEAAASQAVQLTQQLLTFANQKTAQPQELVWSEAIANAEVLLRKLLPERIRIVFKTHTEAAKVRIDLGQLEQILFNLVTNARDAIPGEGTIQVTSAVVNIQPNHPDYRLGMPSGSYFQLTIADTGVGMSQAVMSHLFEPFFTTKEPGQGTGLGLSTVYGIVRHAGGVILVDSEPGQGTEFRVYLPILQERL
jgi:two-component system cell cycle sensor histidine kinase/response regulator CckA